MKNLEIKLLLVAGARPNFMKIAPIVRALRMHRGQRSDVGACPPSVWRGQMSEIRGRERTEVGDRRSDVGGEQKKDDGGRIIPVRSSGATGQAQIEYKIVHTGQHYDYEMSQAFFDDLEIPEPDFFLEAGSGSHAVQTAKIMTAFEKVCIDEKPDIVIVVGDVNSTLACSIVAKKLLIQVAHVEAGLRSFDLTMPEEINRMVTDSITDYFFVTEKSAVENLIREGKSKDQIYFVGHVMIDNLFHQLERLEDEKLSLLPTYALKKELGDYIFLTLHRPSNVDSRETLAGIAGALNEISAETPIVFPVHPRTQKMLDEFDIQLDKRIFLLAPLNFKESLFLWKDAILVITDSGGLQEETTAFGVPCMTLRENTERPITLELGTNTLAGNRKEDIINCYRQIIENGKPDSVIPPKWDGRAAERIVDILAESRGQRGRVQSVKLKPRSSKRRGVKINQSC